MKNRYYKIHYSLDYQTHYKVYKKTEFWGYTKKLNMLSNI